MIKGNIQLNVNISNDNFGDISRRKDLHTYKRI